MKANADLGSRAELNGEHLFAILCARFSANCLRHENIQWPDVEQRLRSRPDKFRSLLAMEASGGEPDVVGWDSATGEYLFMDCSPESPEGRRSLCFDRKALRERKENKPSGTALDMAAEMGVEILSEGQYRELQQLGIFDTKTSSWVQTPFAIRKLGGALFCDRRYDTVFVYHNGASSYYAARGFRACLRV
jgi:hypothetical protein